MLHFKSTFATKFIKRCNEIRCSSQTMHTSSQRVPIKIQELQHDLPMNPSMTKVLAAWAAIWGCWLSLMASSMSGFIPPSRIISSFISSDIMDMFRSRAVAQYWRSWSSDVANISTALRTLSSKMRYWRLSAGERMIRPWSKHNYVAKYMSTNIGPNSIDKA